MLVFIWAQGKHKILYVKGGIENMVLCEKSFDELTESDMETVFGGLNENAQPRFITIVIPASIKVSALISAGVSAISGVVSYNNECLGWKEE